MARWDAEERQAEDEAANAASVAEAQARVADELARAAR